MKKSRFLFGILFVLAGSCVVLLARRDAKMAQLNRDLVMAAVANAPMAARAALTRGANPNGWQWGMKPETVWPLQTFRPLLWLSLKVQGQDTYSTPVLVYAASAGETGIVKELLAHGADPNIRGRYGETPLMVAAGFGEPSCLRALLDRGADASLSDTNGCTALDWARNGGPHRRQNAELLESLARPEP